MAEPRAIILGCAGPVLDPAEAAFLGAADPWGFILFARNVEAPAQLRRLVAALREAVGRDAPVLIDQEGGRVARLRPPHWRDWTPPMDFAAGFPDEAAVLEGIFLRYRLIAEELAALGIDVDCVPVADLPVPGAHPVIGSRAFATDPLRVALRAREAAAGLRAGGVLPVLKHLPGHGRAGADSHEALPVVEAPRALLAATDFLPFRHLRDLPLGMTAHVTFTAIDPAAPATLSAACIRAIREEIGFGGLLMSDDLSMGALGGPLGQRAARALAAGCDLVLHCNGDRAEMEACLAETPRLAGPALERARAAEAARQPPEPFEAGAALARLAALARREPAHA